MQHRDLIPLPSSSTAPPARRRRLRLLEPPPDDRTAAAMGDEREAQQLIDDLAALIEVGLITPIDDDGQLRLAAIEPDASDFAA